MQYRKLLELKLVQTEKRRYLPHCYCTYYCELDIPGDLRLRLRSLYCRSFQILTFFLAYGRNLKYEVRISDLRIYASLNVVN